MYFLLSDIDAKDVLQSIILVDFDPSTVQNFLHLVLNGSVCCQDQGSYDDLQILISALKAGFANKRTQEEDVLVKTEPEVKLQEPNFVWGEDDDEFDCKGLILKQEDFQSESSSDCDTDEGRSSAKRRKKEASGHSCTFCNESVGEGWSGVVEHLESHIHQTLDKEPALKVAIKDVEDRELGGKSQKDFDCIFCYRSVSSKDRLVIHLESHLNLCRFGAEFRCRRCRLRFNNLNEVFVHQQLHELERKGESQCGTCGYVCKQPMALGQHKKAFHPEESEKIENWKCDVCFKPLKTETALRYHLELHQSKLGFPDGTVNDSKDVCKFFFHRKLNTFSFICCCNVYTGLVCDICGFKTNRKTGFESHLQTHLDVKRYKCNECNQSFSVKYLLTNHLRKHKGLCVLKANFVQKKMRVFFFHKKQERCLCCVTFVAKVSRTWLT